MIRAIKKRMKKNNNLKLERLTAQMKKITIYLIYRKIKILINYKKKKYYLDNNLITARVLKRIDIEYLFKL